MYTHLILFNYYNEKKTRAYKAKDKESLFLLLTEKKQTTNIRQGYPILYVPLLQIVNNFTWVSVGPLF